MPILPKNRALYPDDWAEIRAEVLERDEHKCKHCGIPNYEIRPDTKTKVVLTTAHLDHNPTNNGVPGNRPNLAALCQACHNRHDLDHRLETRQLTRARKFQEAGQGDIFTKGD